MANYLSCRCLQSVKWDDSPHTSLRNVIQSSGLAPLRLLGQFSHTSFLQCPVWIQKVTGPWVLCNVNIKASHKEHSYVNQLFCQSNCFMLHKHRNYSHILQLQRTAGFQTSCFWLYLYWQLCSSCLTFQNEEPKRLSASESIVSSKTYMVFDREPQFIVHPSKSAGVSREITDPALTNFVTRLLKA